MEQQKKRHNPVITEEDRAVKAFDRNNDAVPTSALTLDKAVEIAQKETDKVQVGKGWAALRDEFNHLIWKVFGDVRFQYWDLWNNHPKIDDPTLQDTMAGFFATWDLYRRTGNIWSERYKKHVSIEPEMHNIFDLEGFYPIKVKAYTPEALKQAKVFVVAYEKFTGQKATLFRECRDAAEMDEKLEQIIEKKTEPVDEKAVLDGLNIIDDPSTEEERKIKKEVSEFRDLLKKHFSKEYKVRRTLGSIIEFSPGFGNREFYVYKSFFGLPVTAAEIEKVWYWTMSDKRLDIKVHTPEVLPAIAGFAKEYESMTRCAPRIIRMYKEEPVKGNY